MLPLPAVLKKKYRNNKGVTEYEIINTPSPEIELSITETPQLNI